MEFQQIGTMNLDELQDGIFKVWQPNSVDLIKGLASDLPDNALAAIGGLCSPSVLDRQGKNVFQKGLSFGEFVQFGCDLAFAAVCACVRDRKAVGFVAQLF